MGARRSMNTKGGNVRSLQLHDGGNSVGDSGAQALAALKDAPSLHTLSLDLRGNSVGDRGAQALAALKDAPSLMGLFNHGDPIGLVLCP